MTALERPQLQVGALAEAKDFVAYAAESYALISLLCREEVQLYGLPAVDPTLCRDHLWIDVDDVPGDQEGAMIMDQAEEIDQFVRALPPVDTLYVHCFTGQSRAAAVAAALSKAQTGDDGAFWAERQLNEHVYELALDALARAGQEPSTGAPTRTRWSRW